MNRRSFIKISTITAGALMVMPNRLFASDITKIVVIGGGVGGATVAKYLRKFMPQTALVEIKIIEPKEIYITPFGINEVLTNTKTIEELTVDYKALEALVKTTIIHQKATEIDSSAKVITTEDGAKHPYDYCIVATGIDFEYSDIEGITKENNHLVPHAYDFNQTAQEITELKTQLQNMTDGATVAIVAPKNSYRCPPAPYERASQIAEFLTEHKPNSKVIILDPKSSFAKQDSFEKAWEELYGYKTTNAKIEYKSETITQKIEIDGNNKTITTDTGETIQAEVVSYIPTMKASKLTYDAGLVQSGTGAFDMAKRWCPINHETFESTMTGKEGIYIIGDSIRSNLPKSGYSANSQAKACAIAITAKIKGLNPTPQSIITNGCYSFIAKDYAIFIFQKFKLNSTKTDYELVPQSRGTSPLEADASWRAKEAEQGHGWYWNFRGDCFGV